MEPLHKRLSPAGFAGGQGRTPGDAEAAAQCAAVVGLFWLAMLATACVVGLLWIAKRLL